MVFVFGVLVIMFFILLIAGGGIGEIFWRTFNDIDDAIDKWKDRHKP